MQLRRLDHKLALLHDEVEERGQEPLDHLVHHLLHLALDRHWQLSHVRVLVKIKKG